MAENTCKSCQYYYQHYALKQGSFFRVYCGHCSFGSPRKKIPDAKACEHFVPGIADTDHFVTKEYLSKALLEHMLKLELLPPIEDFPYPQQPRKNQPPYV